MRRIFYLQQLMEQVHTLGKSHKLLSMPKKNKQKEKDIFLAIANQILKQDGIKIVACF